MLRTTVSRVGDSLPDIYIDNETAIPPRGKIFKKDDGFPPDSDTAVYSFL